MNMLRIAFWFSFVDADDDDVVNAAAAAAANKIVIKLSNVLRYGYLA